MGKRLKKKVAETPLSVWFKGLAAAIIGGALGGAAEVAQHGWQNTSELRNSAITGALLVAAAYLKSSPLTPTK